MAWDRLLLRIREHVLARVSKNAFALLFAQVGARVLNLVLIAQVTRILGAAGLGRYLLAMTAQAIALAIVDLGLNTYAIREFSKAEAARETPPWGAVLGIKLVAALGGILALNLLVAPFVGHRWSLIAIVSPSLLPDAYNALATALIKARQKMEISSAIHLGTRLLYVLAGGLLVWRGSDEHVLLATYGAVSLLGSLAFGCVLRWWRVPCRLRGSLGTWHSILRESTPFAITSVVGMLYTRLDLLLLSYWHGDTAAGLYGAAYRVWEALGMIPSSFLDALFPALSRASSRPEGVERLRDLYRRGRQFTWIGLAALALPAQIFAGAFMALLYGHTPDTQVYTGILRVLLLAFPFTYMYLLNGHALYALGMQRRVTVAMVAITAANALCNVLLIPRWRYSGAATAKLLSEVLLFILLQAMLWATWRARLPEGSERAELPQDG